MQVICHQKSIEPPWRTKDPQIPSDNYTFNVFLNNNVQVYEPADFWSLVLRVRTSV